MGGTGSKLTESYFYMPRTNTDKHPCKTFTECIRYHAEKKPEREAVVFASTDGTREVVTFEELNKKCQEVARAYVRMGIKRDEIIAINVRPCPDWLFLTFGAMFAGAVPISISFTYTDGSDVIAMFKKLRTCAMLIFEPGSRQENWNIISRLINNYSKDGHVQGSQLNYLRYVVCQSIPESTTDICSLNDMLHDVPKDIELPEVAPSDIAVLFQTSGSTGIPKCVVYTHSLVDYFLNTLFNTQYFTPDDVFFNDRPFGWAGGFPFSVIAGQTRVTKSGFSPEPEDNTLFSIDVIRRENCNVMLALPPSMHDFIKHKEKFQGFKLKTISAVGQPIGENLAVCAGQLCKFFIPGYGSTEALFFSGFAFSNPSDFQEFSSGYPFKGVEVKIVDENEVIVPIGSVGEIYVRHPNAFKEYLHDPEKTAAVMTNDGWLKMDDLGRLNENGVLYAEGRKSNMILSGGMNIAPEILEATIEKCPGIASVVVVPVSDDILYQVICACVILKTGSDVKEVKIRDFCETIHNDKPRLFTVLPKFYMILNEYPETNTGKTSRKELTLMAEKKFAFKQ